MMRLFVAIWVPEHVLQELPFEKLRANIDRQGVRFTKPDKIHLTLRFLGNVLDEDLPALTAALAERLAGVRAVSLSVKGIGAFPGMARPAVVWAGVKGDLSAVHERVVEATDDYAERPDDKRFEPHLTLARVSPPSQKVGRALEPLVTALEEAPFGSWIANEVLLIQSMSDGSYRQVATFALTDAGG